jgi:phosphoenolpyruvate carboxylase
VRKAAIRQREGGVDAGLDRLLAGLEPAEVMRVIHAFSAYLRVVNLAEKVHRIRRRRDYQRAGAEAQPGSLEAVIGTLREAGVKAPAVAAAIGGLRIQPVFTAHPTEATRRTIQEKEYDIVVRLVERLNPELTPDEQNLARERIRASLTSSWQTRIMPHARPTVADELDNILFYLTEILYRVTPRFYDGLREAYEQHYGQGSGSVAFPGPFPAAVNLRFGSWVGGDMDGNPNVTAATVLETLAMHRAVIIRRYLPDVRKLARYLSQSLTEIGVSDEVSRQPERYRACCPGQPRFPSATRTCPTAACLLVAKRLEGTLADAETAYASADEFAADILAVSDSLRANRGEHAGLFGVERLLTRIRTFGFHLATLDVRQDALLLRRVIGELLGCADWLGRDPGHRADVLAQLLATDSLPGADGARPLSDETTEALAVFRAISTARQLYGSPAIGLFIISMAQGADDVLTVLALAEIANPHTGASKQLDGAAAGDG